MTGGGAWAILVCTLIGVTASAEPSPKEYVVDDNVLLNGDFHEWKGNVRGVTTESVGTPPNSLPTHWYGGPGVGAIATYDRIASDAGEEERLAGPYFFRVKWSKPQSNEWPGEAHHASVFRFSFLESFELADVRRFAGKHVRVSFLARAPTGKTVVVPILWHSYDSQTPGVAGVKGKGYELFESSGQWGKVAVAQGRPDADAACELGPSWQRFKRIIALPDANGKSITPGDYTGVGFDLVARGAPTIDLANIEVREVRAVDTK